MQNNKTKGLVPPKLNTPFLIMGFKPLELLIFISMFIIFGLTINFSLIILMGISMALLFRLDGEINVVGYFKILYKYYTTPQHFTIKEVKDTYEVINDSSYYK